MDIEQDKPQLDLWLQQEKEYRLNNDAIQSTRVLTEIVEYLYSRSNFGELFNQLKWLAQKRGQSKKAIISMVQAMMKHINEITVLDIKLKLIDTLKDVCDKKIYLEVEYARCCLMMVKFNESSDNIDQAAKIMQEVQVETYGSMDKREKLEFILYQMKIMIKKQDFVRLYIISQKINLSKNEDSTISDLKVQYYAYLNLYYIQQNDYLQSALCYKFIFDTLNKNSLTLNELDFNFNCSSQNIFENFIIFTTLCERSQQKQDLLEKFSIDYNQYLEQNQILKNLVQNFLSTELISCQFQNYQIQKLEIFNSQKQQQYLTAFRKQLVQNNLVIFQKYYEQVQLNRISVLIDVGVDEIENELCDLINKGDVIAKINRVTSIVNFKPKYSESQELNQWSADLQNLLDQVDSSCNQIKRQNEIYAI